MVITRGLVKMVVQVWAVEAPRMGDAFMQVYGDRARERARARARARDTKRDRESERQRERDTER